MQREADAVRGDGMFPTLSEMSVRARIGAFVFIGGFLAYFASLPTLMDGPYSALPSIWLLPLMMIVGGLMLILFS